MTFWRVPSSPVGIRFVTIINEYIPCSLCKIFKLPMRTIEAILLVRVHRSVNVQKSYMNVVDIGYYFREYNYERIYVI